MAGVEKNIGRYLGNAVAVSTLGTIDTGKKKPFSAGVFGGLKGAKSYGQVLGHQLTLGAAAKTPGQQERELRENQASDFAIGESEREEREAKLSEVDPRLEEAASRRRAKASASRLGGGGRRRASESLTSLGGV